MSPRRTSVTICSAIGLTAFALASVVLIRPCSISDAARFAYSARRCAESRPSFFPDRRCRMASGPEVSAVVAAQLQPVRGERLLDLFDRLLAEVRDRGELALGLGHEVTDRLDADALQAVVRAHAEFELLDGEVLHAVRERRLGRRLGGRHLAEALDPVDVGEDRELADEDV